MPGLAELDNMKEILGWFEGFLNTWEILPYMAVFESVHRTADVGSSMDTFLCG